MINIFDSKNRSVDYPFEDDYLKMEKNVKKTIDEFIESHSQIGSGAVMGLSSPFGTGKSTFIEMARLYMEQKNKRLEGKEYVSAYVNLSENEFHQNPLLIVLKSICRALSKDNEDDKYIRIIIIKLIKLALKMTAPFDTKAFLEESEQLDNRLYRRFIRDDDFAKNKFILYLEEMVKNKKLIVFLDDIDRCSPNFAIKILEQLKFYFEKLNITFVVAYDRNQLEDFLRLRFGQNIDIEGYLQKFFDYNYMFGAIDKTNFIDKTKEKCVEKLKIFQSSKEALNTLIKYIQSEEYQKHLKLYSLRDLQQIIFRIAFGMKYREQVQDGESSYDDKLLRVLVILVFVRRIDRKLYTYLYNGNIDGIEFCYRMYQHEKLKTLFDKDFYIPILFYNKDAQQDNDTLETNVELIVSKERQKIVNDLKEKTNIKNHDTIVDKNLEDIEQKFKVPLKLGENKEKELYKYVQSAFDILEYDNEKDKKSVK